MRLCSVECEGGLIISPPELQLMKPLQTQIIPLCRAAPLPPSVHALNLCCTFTHTSRRWPRTDSLLMTAGCLLQMRLCFLINAGLLEVQTH